MPFYTRTETQLEQDLKDCEEQMASASRNLSFGSGDVSATKQFILSLEQTQWKLLLALNKMNPTAWPIDGTDIPVNRVRVSFGRSNTWQNQLTR